MKRGMSAEERIIARLLRVAHLLSEPEDVLPFPHDTGDEKHDGDDPAYRKDSPRGESDDVP